MEKKKERIQSQNDNSDKVELQNAQLGNKKSPPAETRQLVGKGKLIHIEQLTIINKVH